MRAGQVARLLELTRAVAQQARGLEDPAVKLGHRRLAGAWVPKEDAVERQRVRRLAVELALVVGPRKLDDLVDGRLDRVQANHVIEFVQRVAKLRHVSRVRRRADDIDDPQRLGGCVAAQGAAVRPLEEHACLTRVAEAAPTPPTREPACCHSHHVLALRRRPPVLVALRTEHVGKLALGEVLEVELVVDPPDEAVIKLEELPLHVVLVPR
mmetsp:Transcript_41966/g.57048  ORF Transcript_41966/g.57048 Transcript_41966/m.57048 type:complete len:211 (+) Transcript_41966:2020-2652(+)|eukprot:scaffold320393_cov28-Tisochrysis_lutea.AAC.7